MSFLKQVIVVGVVCLANLADATTCKTLPSALSSATWAAFNKTLGGQLIKPVAPAAPCHPDQASYNAATCTTIQSEWTGFPFHRSNPVSSAWENYNNDTCLPDASYSCSTAGYPAYVINATSEAHVQLGVAFAALHNIRLIVKGTGHDYMGRSSAPNSLSIWTYNLKGFSYHSTFKPAGCSATIKTTAITVAAGHDMQELYAATDAVNQTIVGGEAEGVGIGGYLTGGGHSALSVSYGMAADNVLEVTMVTPTGSLITANECTNTDLFWAIRGGGGGTFGVITSATIKTYPTPSYAILDFTILMATASDAYWDMQTYMLSQYPSLSNQGISGYPYVLPEYEVAPGVYYALYTGKWHDHNSPYGQSNLTAIFDPIWTHIKTTWGSSLIEFVNATTYYHTRYEAHLANHDESVTGTDTVLGSRLLTEATLSGNQTALKEAIKGFTGTGPNAGSGPFLLGGRGVRDAVPRGGSDAVLPAWRSALAHVTTQGYWTPQNATSKAEVLAANTAQTQFLRDLQPVGGVYVNEADIQEPDWQTTFWGSNYAPLLAIKKLRDPNNVLWCFPCVGSETWHVVGDLLCKV